MGFTRDTRGAPEIAPVPRGGASRGEPLRPRLQRDPWQCGVLRFWALCCDFALALAKPQHNAISRDGVDEVACTLAQWRKNRSRPTLPFLVLGFLEFFYTLMCTCQIS